MKQSKEILKLTEMNHGLVTTAMVTEAGLSRGSLKYLVDKGILERVSRGVYSFPEIWEDEMFNLQSRFKKGVFSVDTALFLFDLSDRTPNRYHMTFPNTYNLSKPKQAGICCNSVKESWFEYGIIEVKSPGGNMVRTYNMERTLCDILRPKNHTDIQIISEAFKRYVLRKEKDIPLLSRYAQLFKVENKLRSYLEVLL